MTMENNELNNKILKNVRNKIVVSNLEREESMKLNKRKQIISVLTASLIILSGGFLTVNAATDGKLVEDIKDVITIKLDNDGKYKVTTEKNSEGDEIVKYKIDNLDGVEGEMDLELNKTELIKENLGAEIDIDSKTENGEAEIDLNIVDYNK